MRGLRKQKIYKLIICYSEVTTLIGFVNEKLYHNDHSNNDGTVSNNSY